MKLVLLIVTVCFLPFAHAKKKDETIIRIESGSNYDKYSNEDLRRRVWELERAVQQLQNQVFQLAMNGNDSGSTFNGNGNNWTCQMSSFGKTLVSSGNTRASALAQVLKKCADNSNAVHCREADAKCGNE